MRHRGNGIGHHIQIQARGYSTLDVNVNVLPGQIIPYAGDLQHN